MIPESLIGLGRIVALGQIGVLARTRGPRTSIASECADAAPCAWERVANVRQSHDPPNQRLHGFQTSAVRPPGSVTGALGANAASRGDSRSAMDTLAPGCSRTAPRSRPGDRRATALAATACTRSVRSVGAPRLARHRPASRFRLGPEPPAPAVDSQSQEHGHGPPATLRRASWTLRIPCFARPPREASVSITRRRHGV